MRLRKSDTARWGDIFPYFLFLLLIVCYFMTSWTANSDFSKSISGLFMDEREFVRDVRLILDATNPKDFYDRFFVGYVQHYGRIFFDVNAGVIGICRLLHHPEWDIFALRTFQAVLLLASYLIFIFGLLEKLPTRLFALAVLLCLPHTPYFATLPKPEPMQLFFLAIFLTYCRHRGFRCGKEWTFAGLAFGTKISVLPVLIFAVVITTATLARSANITEIGKQLAKAFGFFLVGFFIAVPSLPLSVFDSSLIHRYISHTFGYTQHSHDLGNISATHWYYNLDQSAEGKSLLFLVVLSPVTLLAAYWLTGKNRSKRTQADLFQEELLLTGAGFLWLILIFIFTKRIWTFYVHPGFVLLVLGLFRLTEKSDTLTEMSGQAAALLFVATQIQPTFLDYQAKAHRSRNPYTVEQMNRLVLLTQEIDEIARRNHRRLKVLWDPFLFTDPPTTQFETQLGWGVFSKWEENFDILTFYQQNRDYQLAANPNNLIHEDLKRFRSEGPDHLVRGDRCAKPPCYRIMLSRDGQVNIWVRSDLR